MAQVCTSSARPAAITSCRPASRRSFTCMPAQPMHAMPHFLGPCIMRRVGGLEIERRGPRVVSADASATDASPAPPVTDASFEEEVLKAKVPVLVDFWAPWCGPCRMIAPLIDEIATEYEGRLKAYKLNTDESPGVATEYGIRSIPTVMLFKDGVKMDTVIGAVPKQTLVQTLEKYLES